MSWAMLFFILVGAVSIAAAIGVVTSRQPIHGALYLLVHFASLAVMYITLEAQFLAAIQVIIYAGGIVILILFVIMLLGSGQVEDEFKEMTWGPYIGLALGLVLIGSLMFSMMSAFGGAPTNADALAGGSPYAVGMALFTRYLLPVELVAVLLLVALIGALLVARLPDSESAQ